MAFYDFFMIFGQFFEDLLNFFSTKTGFSKIFSKNSQNFPKSWIFSSLIFTYNFGFFEIFFRKIDHFFAKFFEDFLKFFSTKTGFTKIFLRISHWFFGRQIFLKNFGGKEAKKIFLKNSPKMDFFIKKLKKSEWLLNTFVGQFFKKTRKIHENFLKKHEKFTKKVGKN